MAGTALFYCPFNAFSIPHASWSAQDVPFPSQSLPFKSSTALFALVPSRSLLIADEFPGHPPKNFIL